MRRKTGLRIHEIEIIEQRLLRKVQPYVRAIKIRETAVSTEMTNERVLVEEKSDEENEQDKCSHDYGR